MVVLLQDRKISRQLIRQWEAEEQEEPSRSQQEPEKPEKPVADWQKGLMG